MRVAGPSLASFRFQLGLVFIGAHNREHARRLLWISGIFGTTGQVGGVVIDLEEVGLPGELEVSEVMLAMRVILGIEVRKALHCENDSSFQVERQFCDALRHDNLAADE